MPPMPTTDPAARRRTLPADARITFDPAASDGWPLRRFSRAGAGRGALMFQGGRGDVFEKYLEALGDWHDRGWAVTAFDWRGQGGSGRLCADPHVGHCDDFAPWIDDLAGVWRAWTARHDGPHVIVGHSMGGYLALRALLDGVIRADAVVLVAPMLGLRSPVGAWVGGRVARTMRRHGDPARPAWKSHERPGRLARQALLTADDARYADEAWWLDANPVLRLGPPSWAWLDEAFVATARLRADPALATLTTPVLMLVAEDDRLVDPRAAAQVAGRLPDATLVQFGKGAAHELLREADPVRGRAMAAIDDFLARHAA
ncbi:lysophospholipase [Sphingomonas sp. Leaf231]|uniref:alpha/beta fold hydrolase n=1 Tax=Sphingomonas sp. Leaf231 TaxID=1736301 RepID=UPI0006F2B1C8|nr:alpha/beta hydrolase [Sphingomonas sp. Leaf231]KQN93986.1 lysophospholipase [Sphingomonas sp. Leaf231]